ncbi:MAG: hypothetical protein J6Y07_01805 [Alphaproteobacteria bacterium]|nr:hypothetical protein [Alphaproteobacteria bacterium]
MDESKLQKQCLTRLRNWPRWRHHVNCNGDRLEYNDMVIEQAVGKDEKFGNDKTIYKITMDGTTVLSNHDIDMLCSEIFRRYLKIDITWRKNTKELAIGIGYYLLVVGVGMVLFSVIFLKCCDGKVPVIEDENGWYNVMGNNSSNKEIQADTAKFTKDKLAFWAMATNRTK